MRILHISLYYPPVAGTTAEYAQHIVKHTRDIQNGFDVRVLTSNLQKNNAALPPDRLLDDPMHVQRLHHLRLPFSLYPRLQALFYYIGHHKPDIIHTYDIYSPNTRVAAAYAHKYAIPLILHPCTSKRPSLLKTHHLTKAAAIITHSPKEQDAIQHFAPNTTPAFLVSPQQLNTIKKLTELYRQLGQKTS
jgi:glycosyltransferase involved in cell wall biosynthesis